MQGLTDMHNSHLRLKRMCSSTLSVNCEKVEKDTLR